MSRSRGGGAANAAALAAAFRTRRAHAATLSTMLALLLALAAAQPSIDQPRLFPSAAHAPGIPEVRYDALQSAYLFALRDAAGSVTVEYRLPLAHPYLLRGVLRIEETTTGLVPIDAGGCFFRTSGVPANGLGRLSAP